MTIITIVYTVAVCVFAVIGIIIGAVKGFSKVRSWALELVLALLCTCLVAYIVRDSDYFSFWVIGAAIVFILIFMLLLGILRKSMAHLRGSGRCVGGDRVLGAVALGVKGAVIFSLVFGVVFAALNVVFSSDGSAVYKSLVDSFDFMTGEGMQNFFDELWSFFDGGFWTFVSPYILDVALLAFISSTMKSGYRHGAFSALWVILILALVVGAGFLSYYLVTQSASFISFSDSMGAALSDAMGFDPGSDMVVSVMPVVGKVIVGAVAFIVMLIVLIILGCVGERFIKNARVGKTVGIVDGVFGSILLTALCLAVLLFVGGVLNVYNTAEGMDFMTVLNIFAANNMLTSAFYDRSFIFCIDGLSSIVEFFETVSLVKYMT